jgi:hypothetical protein
MARGKKFTAEQIIGKLREAEVGLAQSKTVLEVARKSRKSRKNCAQAEQQNGGITKNRSKHAMQR